MKPLAIFNRSVTNVQETLQSLTVGTVSGIIEVDYNKGLIRKLLLAIAEGVTEADLPLLDEAADYLKTARFTHPDPEIAAKLEEIRSNAPLAKPL
jgi:hypothetical protein